MYDLVNLRDSIAIARAAYAAQKAYEKREKQSKKMETFEENIEESFEEKLISLVKAHDFLYNAQSRTYRNVIKRDRAWMKISTRLRKPVEDCKQRWKSLRDRYVREKRRAASGSAAGDTYEWEYMAHLNFLENAKKSRNRAGKLDLSEDTYIDSDDPIAFESIEATAESLPTLPMSPWLDSSRARSRSPQSKKGACNISVHEFPEQSPQALNKPYASQPPSENKLFMMAMAKKMDVLPIRTQMRLQEEILKLVNDEVVATLDELPKGDGKLYN